MNKIEHLKLIQEVIGRLSSYSNTIKSWTVSLITITITIGFSISDGDQIKIALLLSLGIAVLFMILDMYYYMLEKSYRNLFDFVRKLSEEEIDFKMGVQKRENEKDGKYTNVRTCALIGFKSPSILLLYLPIIFGGIIAMILL